MHKNETFLVVDDDEQSNFIFTETLKDASSKAESIVETNGWDALKFLNSSEISNSFPNVIIVDLNMPKMDGFEFIAYYENRFYRKFPTTKVVILTNSQNPDDRQKSLKFKSVSGYFNKPVTVNVITEILSESL